MSKVKSFWRATKALANADVGQYFKGLAQAAINNNANSAADRSVDFIKGLQSRNFRNKILTGVGALGIGAGAGYMKGKTDGMKKQAGWNPFASKTVTQKVFGSAKKGGSKLLNYLQNLPTATKEHLAKKVKIKRGYLYGGSAAAVGTSAGAGYLMGKKKEGK